MTDTHHSRGLTHRQAQYLLQSGKPIDEAGKAALQAHLSICEECRKYGQFILWMDAALPSSFPVPQVSEAEARQRARRIHEQVRSRRLVQRLHTGLRTVAWSGAAVIFILAIGWIIRNALFVPQLGGPDTPTPVETALGSTAAAAIPTPLPTDTPEVGQEPAPPAVSSTATSAGSAQGPGQAPGSNESVPASTPETGPGAEAVQPPSPAWLAFVSERDGYPALFAIRSDGAGLTRIAQDLANISNPDWSPDGAKIAFQATSAENGSLDILTVNLDGTGLKNLTDGPSDEFDPAWSPDGSQIAFMSDRDRAGRAELYLMKANGSKQTRLTHNNAWQGQPDWSPDGAKIVFASEQDGNPEIYVIHADGSGQQRLTEDQAGDGSPAWSPDGRRIIFSSDRDGKGEIYIMWADGSAPTNLTQNPQGWDYAPAWSAYGGGIAFVRSIDSGQSGLYIMASDGSSQEWIANTAGSDSAPNWYAGFGVPPGLAGTPTETGPSERQAEPTPLPEETTGILNARQALEDFFRLLNEGQYEEASALYGGSYQELIAANPMIDPQDRAALLKSACEVNGYRCLPASAVTFQEEAPQNAFVFLVEFVNPDGSPVSRARAGADGAPENPETQFSFTVVKTETGDFLVQELPVLLP